MLQEKKESIYLHRLSEIQHVRREAKIQKGGVVQLVRISACHAEGREFESRRHRFFFLKFNESKIIR